jgi:hypothetical protein
MMERLEAARLLVDVDAVTELRLPVEQWRRTSQSRAGREVRRGRQLVQHPAEGQNREELR